MADCEKPSKGWPTGVARTTTGGYDQPVDVDDKQSRRAGKASGLEGRLPPADFMVGGKRGIGGGQRDGGSISAQAQHFAQARGQTIRHPLKAEIVGMSAVHQAVALSG